MKFLKLFLIFGLISAPVNSVKSNPLFRFMELVEKNQNKAFNLGATLCGIGIGLMKIDDLKNGLKKISDKIKTSTNAAKLYIDYTPYLKENTGFSLFLIGLLFLVPSSLMKMMPL